MNMTKKLILGLTAFVASFHLVFAVTLTKEVTEKVVIPVAVEGRICVFDEANQQCLKPEEPIVFGTSLVYPKGSTQTPTPLTFFFFRNKIYRSTQLTYKSDSGGKPTSQTGTASFVAPSGVETARAFNYTTNLNPNGTFITQMIDEFAKKFYPGKGAYQDLKIEFLAPTPSGSSESTENQIEALQKQIEELKSEIGRPAVVTETLLLRKVVREVTDITWEPK